MKTNFKGHAETSWPILFSSRGCDAFPPMVSGNFLDGAQTMRTSAHTMRKSAKNAHVDDMHEM